MSHAVRFEDAPRLARQFGRATRLVRWIHSSGLRAVAVEHEHYNPFVQVPIALRKQQWRRAHPQPAGLATPVWIVGAQRSGTNMLLRALHRVPELDVLHEGDRRVFDGFLLADDQRVRRAITGSRHRFVVIKPLCDSHRLPHLLDVIGGTTAPGRALWVYRNVDARVRSAVTKFGASNRDVLADIVSGRLSRHWQVEGISDESMAFLRSFDVADMTPEDGAALFWVIRNRLLLENGWAQRPDVLPVSYDALTTDPEGEVRVLGDFLDLPHRTALVDGIGRARSAPPALTLSPRIRDACDEVWAGLESARRRRATDLVA